MVTTTPSQFEFIVKVHSQVTHARKDPVQSMADLIDVLQPLMEAGKFHGFLAQFPYAFKNRYESRKYLIELADMAGDWSIFVEFRHRSWAITPLYDFLKQHKIGYVSVDEPQLPNLMPRQCIVTTDVGYVRLHGRNKQTWWDRDKGDRYDYLYSRSELEEFKSDIAAILDRVKKMYLFFNNCYHGQAAQNALDMQHLVAEA